MRRIDRNQRWAGTLLLSLALIQYTAQPLYSAPAAGGVPHVTSGFENPAVPAMDQARTAELVRRTEAPVVFEANEGQARSRFKFISRGAGHTMLIGSKKAVITMRRSEPPSEHSAGPLGPGPAATPAMQAAGGNSTTAAVEMTLLGGSRSTVIEGVECQRGKANYFIGRDPAAWRTGIQTFAAVRERSVYPGIDLVFHGNGTNLEYDFVVAPGADPSSIALAFKGATKVSLDGADLVLSTPAGEMRQASPVSYQEIGGVRKEVASRYEIKSKGRGRLVRFRLGPYDHRLPLTIDPSLVYSGYIGGTTTTIGGVAADAAGNAYIVGEVLDAASFPATIPPANHLGSNGEAFLAKLDPSGVLVYSTIFGGAVGAGADGVAVDAQGNAYVVGGTGSDDFPVTQGAFQPTRMSSGPAGFVMKLNPSGSSIIYSTYLSGSQGDSARYVAVDSSGNAYVAGVVHSADFPTTPGAFQTVDNNPDLVGWGGIFVAKLNPAGSALVYSTFLDGAGNPPGGLPNWNYPSGMAIDSQGNAYIAGTASAADFPTTPGSFQPHRMGTQGFAAFAAKINPAGTSLVYSTYIGESTTGGGVAVDAQGNAYVAGTAEADDFPAVNAIQNRIAGGIILKTTDGGQTSTNIGSGFPPVGGISSGPSSGPVVDPTTPSRVYADVSGKLFRTEDGGGSWSQLGTGLPSTGFGLSAIAIDPSNPSNLFAGVRSLSSAAVFASTDRGDSWHQLSTIPDGGVIEVDPKSSQTIYATTSAIHNGVFTGTTLLKSIDGGNTWNAANQGLPRGIINALVIDPVNTSNLYAGTLAGLFRSNDGGAHWSQPAATNYIRSIALDPRNPSTIYAIDLTPNSQFSLVDGRGRGHTKKRAAQDTDLDGVIKSADGGATWVSMNAGLFMDMSLNVVAVDADGTPYLGAFEGVFKFSSQTGQWAAPANLVYRSTYSIGVDPKNGGTLYLGGKVEWDAFVTKLTPDGATAVYSTLIGGMGQDDARCIALDSAGNVFVSGATRSGNFPVTPNAVQKEWSGNDDVYVAEINASGSAIAYGSYLGGSDDDEPASIAVDAGGNPVVIGVTHSTDFPVKQPTGQPFFAKAGSIMVFKFATQGSSSQQPQVTNASVSGKRLTVQGQSFDQGAVIVIGGSDLPTINDSQNPSSMLVAKKGGRRITPGQQVTIQVRNSDGTMSNPYSYTRPAN